MNKMMPGPGQGPPCKACRGKGTVPKEVTVKGVRVTKDVTCIPCNGSGRTGLLTK